MKYKPDHYSRRAKQEGYPARSVYKLQEIQRRHGVLRPGATVLDIGASPGSWSLFALETVGRNGRVVGVDLKELTISADRRYTFFKGDAFAADLAARILAAGPFDVVLSDAAPSTTGNATVDTARSLDLVERACALAETVLRKGGNLVLKLFQGGQEQAFVASLRGAYSTVKTVRPQAVKGSSFEVFIVAKGKKTGKIGGEE